MSSYRDRKENGTNFDIIFHKEMNTRYTPRQEDEEPSDPGGQEHEQMPHVNRGVQVYSDFNMEMNTWYTPRQEDEEPDPGGQEHEQMLM